MRDNFNIQEFEPHWGFLTETQRANLISQCREMAILAQKAEAVGRMTEHTEKGEGDA